VSERCSGDWTLPEPSSIKIDPQEGQQTLEIVEANLALRRVRTRVEAINVIS